MNQVALMARDFRKSRTRRAPIAPNSPRDSGVGVVIPCAIKPDWVSKSKVRQTMWRGIALHRYDLAFNSGVGGGRYKSGAWRQRSRRQRYPAHFLLRYLEPFVLWQLPWE